MSERYAVVVFNRSRPTAVRGPFDYESEAIAASQVIRLDPDHDIAVLPLRMPDVGDLHFRAALGDTEHE